jgi:hypothetical protein
LPGDTREDLGFELELNEFRPAGVNDLHAPL